MQPSSKKSSGPNHYCPACRFAVDRVDTVCLNCESSRPPTGWPVDPYIGRTIGKKYRIDRRLSVGGFGIVFLATQVHEGQEIGRVIIKMLHGEHAFDPVVTRRFINEVKAARSILSPHVVKIFDLDFDQGNIPFMVQEYVDGQGLADILERHGPVGPARAVSIALQVAEGMEEAHSRDIIHRDLKPENIILQTRGRTDYVKIIDFGIARVLTADGLATTSFVGTPRYMAPEQIKGKQLDGRADIYALGVILFEMIAGRPPIVAKDSDMEYLTLNLTEEADHLRDLVPDVPASLDDLLMTMIARDREERPPTMGAVMEALDRIASEAGYPQEITGEQKIPADTATTSVDGPARDLVSTPLPDGAGPAVPRPPATENLTEERPDSGIHRAAPARGLPLLPVALGAGALIAVIGVVAALLLVHFMREPEPVNEGAATVSPPPERPLDAAKGLDAGADAPPDAAVEVPQQTEPVEKKPTTVAKPPVRKPETKKKPTVTKPPVKKPVNKDDPWTKI